MGVEGDVSRLAKAEAHRCCREHRSRRAHVACTNRDSVSPRRRGCARALTRKTTQGASGSVAVRVTNEVARRVRGGSIEAVFAQLRTCCGKWGRLRIPCRCPNQWSPERPRYCNAGGRSQSTDGHIKGRVFPGQRIGTARCRNDLSRMYLTDTECIGCARRHRNEGKR
jgi:hypothetical protein